MTCAYQMLKAYQHVALGRVFPHGQLYGFKVEHWDMTRERLNHEDKLAKKQRKKHMRELEALTELERLAENEESKEEESKEKPSDESPPTPQQQHNDDADEETILG